MLACDVSLTHALSKQVCLNLGEVLDHRDINPNEVICEAGGKGARQFIPAVTAVGKQACPLV